MSRDVMDLCRTVSAAHRFLAWGSPLGGGGRCPGLNRVRTREEGDRGDGPEPETEPNGGGGGAWASVWPEDGRASLRGTRKGFSFTTTCSTSTERSKKKSNGSVAI
jgi:hypothetical protein